VATTDRGIYYTDGGNDGDVADLNVITKAIADSTEAALDALDGLKVPVSSYNAADVLAKIKTVDGAGSGLDADMLDGVSSAGFATAAQGTKADASLQRSGGVMTGDLNMAGRYILNVGQSGAANDAATVGQVNAVAGTSLAAANNLSDLANKATARTNLQVPKGDRALVTFDGSGNAAITHGWGSAPTWAVLTVESPFSVFPHLVSISSTVLNVRASSLTGIVTSDSVYMHWLVGV
jgi:hypothetical protein